MKKADFDKLRQRNQALARITQITRHGTVDGVHFDLCRDELSPDEWVMEPLGASVGERPRRPLRLPFIWFPWFGIFDPAVLENEVKHEFDARNKDTAVWLAEQKLKGEIEEYDKPKKLPKAWIKSEIKTRTPDAIVLPGDTIVARNMEIVRGDESFLHKHDIEARYLWVDIVHSDGTRKKITTPIVMVGQSSISLRPHYIELYDAIRDRIMRHYNLSTLDDKEILAIMPGFVARTDAEAALFQCMYIFRRYLPSLQDDKEYSLYEEGAYIRALNLGCELGYYWAKAEAEMKMKPLAMAGLKSREGAKTAGEKSGESRRIIADTTWKPHALELAKCAREQNPGLSQQNVATEIAMSWKLKIPTPGHSTLKAFIAHLEKTGTLSRATKSKRG